jgi:hypothetical protein
VYLTARRYVVFSAYEPVVQEGPGLAVALTCLDTPNLTPPAPSLLANNFPPKADVLPDTPRCAK